MNAHKRFAARSARRVARVANNPKSFRNRHYHAVKRAGAPIRPGWPRNRVKA